MDNDGQGRRLVALSGLLFGTLLGAGLGLLLAPDRRKRIASLRLPGRRQAKQDPEELVSSGASVLDSIANSVSDLLSRSTRGRRQRASKRVES